jgi:hypothetical protein
MTGKSVTKELLKSEDRKSDLALLRDLTKSDELTEDEADAFGDIRDRLEDATFPVMFPNQRQWAQDVADRLGISYTRRVAEQAQSVPKGRDVKMPDVLSADSLKAALMARRR